jgi:hypothetical protein
MYFISFYVPESHLDLVKEAMFSAGAGNIGEYAKCCWQTFGEGQFLPLENSNPTIGAQGEITKVVEYKVEMVCCDEKINHVVTALKNAHPYEEPAYQVMRLETI